MTQKVFAQVLQWRVQWYKGHWFSPMPLVKVYLSKWLNMKVSSTWHHFYMNNCDWLFQWVRVSHQCINA